MTMIKSRSFLIGILSVAIPLSMIGLFILSEALGKYPHWKLRTDLSVLWFFSPLVGIILGIVACVLARFDLKQISEELSGLLQRRASRMGLVLGVTGIILAPICFVVVALAIFSTASVVANRDAIRKDLMNIVAQAYEFRIRSRSMEGGGGSYLGYTLTKMQRDNENGTYEISVQSSDTLIILATSAGYTGATLTAVVDANGNIVRSRYTGDFSP